MSNRWLDIVWASIPSRGCVGIILDYVRANLLHKELLQELRARIINAPFPSGYSVAGTDWWPSTGWVPFGNYIRIRTGSTKQGRHQVIPRSRRVYWQAGPIWGIQQLLFEYSSRDGTLIRFKRCRSGCCWLLRRRRAHFAEV